MVSHIQALATPSSTVHSTWILTTEVLAACSSGSDVGDVASGADRHVDMGLQVVEAHPLFPYFLEKRLAILTSPFFHLLVNVFSVTCFRTFFADPLPSFN